MNRYSSREDASSATASARSFSRFFCINSESKNNVRKTELACAVGEAGGKQASLKLTLAQGQPVLVVVDGMATDDSEEPVRYVLHISEYAPTEAGRCADGADNDADGSADQQDPDCR